MATLDRMVAAFVQAAGEKIDDGTHTKVRLGLLAALHEMQKPTAALEVAFKDACGAEFPSRPFAEGWKAAIERLEHGG